MWTLALDQGGHASRALVFDERGDERANHSVAIATERPAPGRVEHDPKALIGSVHACLEGVAQSLGNEVARIGAAALCTQRSTVLAWSRHDGTTLSPVLSWQDVRAADWLQKVAIAEPEVLAITGLRRSPHYGASKLRWCLDHIPAVAAAQAAGTLALGPLASWLVFELSAGATLKVDPCNASRTLLWDLATRDWSPDLCARFDIPQGCLPTSTPNRGAWAALRLGAQRVPLTVVTGDQSAVPFAFDAKPGRAYLTLGTGAFLQQPLDARPSTDTGLLASVLWQDGDTVRYALEGTINGAGAALAWLAERHGVSEASLLERLPRWLDEVATPPLFVNAVGGLAAPYWRPTLEPKFIQEGFIGAGDLDAQAVAVIESIAFLVAANLEAMRVSGWAVDEIVCVGGLARLDGLLQRIADVAGLRVVRATQLEASAYGAARLANPALPPLGTDAEFAPDQIRCRELQGRYAEWFEVLRR